MTPKLSIIIPVHNAELFLRECLDSVINQTFKDIEIIIINDCSPDNSESIILEYMSKDPRIKYVKHDLNKGTYHSRETGAFNSSGEYLLYVDPDDFIDLTFCEKLLPLINQNPDCIIYNFQAIKDGEITVKPWFNKNLHNFTKPFELFNAFTQNITPPHHLIQKIYKREFLLKVYKELNIQERLLLAEDVLVNIYASYYCTSVLYLDFFAYTYRLHDTSITKRTYSLDRALFHLNQLDIVITKLLLLCDQRGLPHSTMDLIIKDLLDFYLGVSYEVNLEHQEIIKIKIFATFSSELIISYFLQHLPQEEQNIQYDKWYLFGQLSKKQKIKKIIVVISKKLKLYPILKKTYNLIKK